MISTVLDAYSKTHIPKFAYDLEQILILNELGYITETATDHFVKLKINQIRYDLEIAREINLRIKDLSSIFRSTKKWSYLANLFSADGPNSESKMRNSQKFTILITHQLGLALNPILIQNDETIYIQCIRHPIYLFEHWRNSLKIINKTERDFTPWLAFKSQPIPWFLYNHYSKRNFLQSNLEEKSILSLKVLFERALAIHNFMRNNPRYLLLNFNNFVSNPNPDLERISELLVDVQGRKLRKVLRLEKVPRIHQTEGKKRKIYQRYGATKKIIPDSKFNELTVNWIKSSVGRDVYKEFEKTIGIYNELASSTENIRSK